jgi:hypothetical protein
MRLVDSGSPIVEDEHGQLLQRVVLRRLCRVVPGHFCLEFEWQVLLLESDSHFAGVWRRRCRDKFPGHDGWYITVVGFLLNVRFQIG